MGGRGSGKTAFVQFHCYSTVLSDKKKEIGNADLENIGIMLKPDSILLSEMFECSLDKLWKPVFGLYMGISIIYELANFLRKFISCSYQDTKIKEEVRNILIPKYLLKSFHIDEELTFINFVSHLNIARITLNNWLAFPDEKPPYIINAKTMISEFIKLIREVDVFKNTNFFIFLDEFENFSEEQQMVVNTWMKHVENNIIYNVIYKKHYEPTFKTLGNENIQERNDYRVIDIDKEVIFSDSNFKLMCCEIIINNLQIYFDKKYDFLEVYEDNYLSSPDAISVRKDEKYRQKIFTVLNSILPSYNLKEIANKLMLDSSLKKKVYKSITDALQYSEKNLEDFVSKEDNKTILNSILLQRKTITINEIHENFIKDTAKYNDWLITNQLGSLLFYYNKFNHKTCPYYGGFDRFLLQSCFNIRHFLELFHKSIVELENREGSSLKLENLLIPIEMQANAAKSVSTYEFDRKISSCGNRGYSLKKIVDRLGKLFAIKQNDPAQRVSEVTQFSIKYTKLKKDSEEKITSYVDELIRELNIWSILIEKDITKVSDKLEHHSLKEYRLHPILSSYFGISPRQKRKFEFNVGEIERIFYTKNDSKFQEVYKNILNHEDNKITEPNLLDLIK